MGYTKNIQDNSVQSSACEGLADEIASGIPALAEARGLPTRGVARSLWIALFCDIIGDDDVDGPAACEMFEAARHQARKNQ